MEARRRQVIFGSAERFGILQRLGVHFYLIAFALLCYSFVVPGHASARYGLLVASHSLLYTGFVIAATGDILAGRQFSWGRLLYAALMGVFMLIAGPVAMGAAQAGWPQ